MSVRTSWARRCARLAMWWSVAFAALHFFWALGGSALLDVSAGPRLAAERPAWFVLGGLWGVGLACLVGAVVARELARPRRPGTVGSVVKLAGWSAGLILLLRAIVVEVLLVAGGAGLENTVGPDQRWWTLVLWNPWFLVGGIAFVGASIGFRRPADAELRA